MKLGPLHIGCRRHKPDYPITLAIGPAWRKSRFRIRFTLGIMGASWILAFMRTDPITEHENAILDYGRPVPLPSPIKPPEPEPEPETMSEFIHRIGRERGAPQHAIEYWAEFWEAT